MCPSEISKRAITTRNTFLCASKIVALFAKATIYGPKFSTVSIPSESENVNIVF